MCECVKLCKYVDNCNDADAGDQNTQTGHTKWAELMRLKLPRPRQSNTIPTNLFCPLVDWKPHAAWPEAALELALTVAPTSCWAPERAATLVAPQTRPHTLPLSSLRSSSRSFIEELGAQTSTMSSNCRIHATASKTCRPLSPSSSAHHKHLVVQCASSRDRCQSTPVHSAPQGCAWIT